MVSLYLKRNLNCAVGCKVSPECYGHLTNWLQALAGGRIILCLEGGYNLNSISYAMTMCSKSLLGDPLPMLEQGSIASASGLLTIRSVITTQEKYWPCLRFQVSLWYCLLCLTFFGPQKLSLKYRGRFTVT